MCTALAQVWAFSRRFGALHKPCRQRQYCDATRSRTLRIEQVQPIAGLRRGARVDEKLDQDLAIGGNAVRDFRYPARVFRWRERAADDDLVVRIGEGQLEVGVGQRDRGAVPYRGR